MLLLDTHAVLWVVNEDPVLGKRTLAAIRAAERENALAISSISLWEIALLLSKGRLQSSRTADGIGRVLREAGVREIALTGEMGILATGLDLHPDPADRFIVATAIVQGATLVTADQRLLEWKHALRRQNAAR